MQVCQSAAQREAAAAAGTAPECEVSQRVFNSQVNLHVWDHQLLFVNLLSASPLPVRVTDVTLHVRAGAPAWQGAAASAVAWLHNT